MIGFLWRSLALCLLAALIGTILAAPDYCSNFDDVPGRCISYRRCPSISAIVRKRRSGRELSAREQYIWSHADCSEEKKSYVCCVDGINVSGLEMLRNETECGKFTLAKVTNGREVRIGSRPWMALLRYNETTNYRNQFACGATLISKRFVLTAAHCMNTANPVAVRLGEHNLSTEEDCVMVRSQTRCQPAPQDIGIEKIILHEGFPENVTHNDIALIKLNRDVEYSPQINSICLPLSQQKAILEQSIYLVTGWGMTENRTMSNVPMEAYVNRVDTQDCKDAYSKYAFVDTQICVSGEAQDSCSGDSGGPLQSLFRYHGQQRFVQVGIVSFGPANCGQGSLPSVYTDVMAFLPWITNQIARS